MKQQESLKKLQDKEDRLRFLLNGAIGSNGRPLLSPEESKKAYEKLAKIRKRIKAIKQGT